MEWKKEWGTSGIIGFNGFDVLITADKNLKNQQNIKKFDLSIIVLNAPNIRIDTLSNYIQIANQKLSSGLTKGIIEINQE